MFGGYCGTGIGMLTPTDRAAPVGGGAICAFASLTAKPNNPLIHAHTVDSGFEIAESVRAPKVGGSSVNAAAESGVNYTSISRWAASYVYCVDSPKGPV